MNSQNYKDWVQERVAEKRFQDDEALQSERIKDLVNRYIYETQVNRDEFGTNSNADILLNHLNPQKNAARQTPETNVLIEDEAQNGSPSGYEQEQSQMSTGMKMQSNRPLLYD